ncbi:MAG: glycosyltransferase family 4 protein [Gemmatimonadaceae bacterium]|nr:glycosyltransferase family 4 protein [Gemmatimonadaceae bacterium]
MSPLRFCFPTTFYPPYSFGGDAVGVQRLARALVRRGHEVTVVHDMDAYTTLHDGPMPQAPRRDDGVEVISLESRLGPIAVLLAQQTGRPTVHRRTLTDLLDNGKFDVINYHNSSLVGGPGLFSYGAAAAKVFMAHEHWLVCPTHVLWRHNRELCDARQCTRCQIRYHRPPQLWRHTGHLVEQLKNVDLFIAMSEFSRQKHYEFGFPHEMEVLPYFLADPDPDPATDSVPEPPPHARPYFLFVGRLEKIKGLDSVIPVFRDYPDADLLIAGDGNYADTLKALAVGAKGVKFLGRVALDSLTEYYQHAIATIVPSVCYETFGIILIESFKQRTPVIARNLGPFPEIVSASGGGEVFDTQADLLLSMRRLQSDPAYRETLAANGYNGYATRWSESAVVPRYLEMVESVRR